MATVRVCYAHFRNIPLETSQRLDEYDLVFLCAGSMGAMRVHETFGGHLRSWDPFFTDVATIFPSRHLKMNSAVSCPLCGLQALIRCRVANRRTALRSPTQSCPESAFFEAELGEGSVLKPIRLTVRTQCSMCCTLLHQSLE